METQTDPSSLNNKIILDAGCGNGILTYHIAKNNASTVFGVDYSFTLLHNATVMISNNLGWIIADIGCLPFCEETFDLIISNGVLHHTRNTKESFNKITPFVKKGAKLYIWLYRRPLKLVLNLYLYFLEFIRFIVRFMPGRSKLVIVHLYACWIYLLKTALGKMKTESYQDIFINAHDFITPRYRHCHNLIEVSLWYFENGFSPVTITHWDNPHGFGVLAEKHKMENTPGINYTRENFIRRVD
jgi:ubiquinone/menaquinone biosynthesis C-methylase UbiE